MVGAAQISLAGLRSAAAEGKVLDGRSGGGRAEVAASDIRTCLRTFQAEFDPRGLRIHHARVTGSLDLSAFDLPYPLVFRNCEFTDPPDLQGADLHGLDLIDCTMPGLLANGLRVQRDVDLSRSIISGSLTTSVSVTTTAAVWLCEARIQGQLLGRGTRINGLRQRALQADRLEVHGSVRLTDGFYAQGEIRLQSAQVGGSFELSDFRIESLHDWGLNLAYAEIGGDCRLGAQDTAAVVRGRVHLAGARVAGDCEIRMVSVEPSLRPAEQPLIRAPRLKVGGELGIYEHSSVEGELHLRSADLGSLYVDRNCELSNPGGTAFDLTNAQVRASARFASELKVRGRLRMARTRIQSRLVLSGVHLSDPHDSVLLDCHGLTIGGILQGHKLRAVGGRLVLNNVECRQIDLRDAWIGTDAGVGLSLVAARIHGDVSLSGKFECHGRVNLNGALADGWLECAGARLLGLPGQDSEPRSAALSAVSARFDGGMDLTWAECDPRVDFTATTTSSLLLETVRWPKHYALSGLTYQRLEGSPGVEADPWDAELVCAWLDGADFDAGAYEQAARVFRQHGRGTAAEDILIRQRDAVRRAFHSPGRARPGRGREIVDWAFGWAVKYGYRPGRALIALLALLVAVFALLSVPVVSHSLRAADDQGDVYGVHGRLVYGPPLAIVSAPPPRPDACGNGEVRCFNRLFYAVDTVVPLVDLKQRETWYPNAHASWGRLTEYALDIATLLGWLLSSIVVLSFARLARTS